MQGRICVGPWRLQVLPNSTLSCEIKNDPIVTNFDGDPAPLPYPCRYMVSDLMTIMKSQSGNDIGFCEFRVFAFNSKDRGKFYVSGFDVAMALYYNDGPTVQFSYRQVATAKNNINTASTTGKRNAFIPFVPDGTDDVSYTDAANGVYIDKGWDNQNNRYFFTVVGCSVTITLVPYDSGLRGLQKQVPGLSLSLSQPRLEHFVGTTACLGPKSLGYMSLADIQQPTLSNSSSFLLQTFTNAEEQNQPDDNDGQCAEASRILNDCQRTRKRLAMKNCDWMFSRTHFIKCYDKTTGSKDLMKLFNMCVTSWCTNRPCTNAINAIRASGCANVPSVPEMSAFLQGNKCPASQAFIE
ncbi:napsin a aspartic peptidase [Plakobranchus ocellatus]|uniref:Napsin a aspartic peptidase n=1 Tax=Plakobranchus ocellatus TaxID=259542 RepID=A0AAV4DI95_9GAST|nr:napsin a aspartic peptidase [Plakobranchus ocellatus]